jgi:serine/threonine protein kinase
MGSEEGIQFSPAIDCVFYFIYASIRQSTRLRNATNCPTFIVAISGPWIAILGTVFTDGLIVQHLTDYVWAGLDSTLNESRILRIARTFYALNNGLANLRSYYATVQMQSWISETRYFPSITTYPNGNECIHFKYLAFLEDGPDCMTLRARTLTVPPRDVVVKFVDRYGGRAHRLLVDNGLAPDLLYCGSPHLQDKDPSYNSISMVIMELVRGETLDKSEMSGKAAEVVRSEVERALKLLHGHGLVFGDLRAPNVMITTTGNEVKLIDFDWAGEEGRAKYPYLISPRILWPMGVAPLANLEINHDLQMLEQMFLAPIPFVFEDSASTF